MFYIDKRPSSSLKKELALTNTVPTISVFVAFMVVTLMSAASARNALRIGQEKILQRNVERTQNSITERIGVYENILQASSGFVASSQEVTRDEWKQFIGSFELSQRYPGIIGVGYSPVVLPENRDAFEQAIRDSGIDAFTIFPDGERSVYTSVLYFEPSENSVPQYIGYDMYTDPERAPTMETARDTGKVALTQVVELLVNANKKQPSLIMFMPVYEHGRPLVTIADRQQALRGYVYVPFNSRDMLTEATRAVTEDLYGFRVYGGSVTGTLLYESSAFAPIATNKSAEKQISTFIVDDQTWTIEAVVDPLVVGSTEMSRPNNTLVSGMVFSVVIASFMYLLLVNRARNMNVKQQKRIQDAKDELLSLASHQLRTPATGVKQYIGLLRDGYAGELTAEQQLYVEKAYSSNERQLATINEMLVVARADAGNIELDLKEFDVVGLVREMIDEATATINRRHQRLTVEMPDHRLTLCADRRFIRMAFENILSNAMKYTPEKGQISVRLREQLDNICFEVVDNGVGVHEDDRVLLFRKFSRIPNELTNKVTGSGIGLYLAKKIVEAHAGQIAFESTLGQGTTCTIYVPKQNTK